MSWKRIKAIVFDVFERTVRSQRGREAVLEAARQLAAVSPRELGIESLDQPYADLPADAPASGASLRSDVVFVTARFRSGSTLLWNLFRHVEGVTAYYEPLNERRWFDPACRGSRIDATHRGVADYWREYEGLTELAALYDEDWIRRDLYMDERAWAPRMKRYIEVLIERAAGTPVLQFNRVDFRLRWLRAHFPQARIIHLYRHPRDQWCSALWNETAVGPNATMADFAGRDHFYLRCWASDLAVHFPFLREETARHPYELFYYLWRLSYLFGRRFASYSLAYESLVNEPQQVLPELLAAAGLPERDLTRLAGLISPAAAEKWRKYASERWFRAIEERCEAGLADYFLPVGQAAAVTT